MDIDKLLDEATKQTEETRLQLAVLQAALQQPTEITTYNVMAFGYGELDGKQVLTVGLLGGRQLRFLLDPATMTQLHKVTSPSASSATKKTGSDDHVA